MTSTRKQTATAGAIILANISVAVAVNLLTSSWSWLVFAILAVLAAVWIALEARKAAPRRTKGETAPALTGRFVPRPELTNRIVKSLLAGNGKTVGITTAVAGAGGFGKTTLALEAISRPEIRSAFDWVDWLEVGQEIRGGAALADAINNLSENVSGQRPGFTNPDMAGTKLGELLADKGRSLLFVDDIWTAEQLRPFLNAGRGCTLLVTTRIPNLLPDGTDPIPVDQMNQAQAHDLVTNGLSALPDSLSGQLLDITGRWPIALSLINAALRRATRDGADVVKEATRLLQRLQDLGPKALDVTDEARRNRTVAATLESSLGVLGDQRDRVVELAIFREDAAIPLDLVLLLWQKTARLPAEDGYRLAHELAELSLITWDKDRVTLKVHDVILMYLRHEHGPLEQLHDELLNEAAATLGTAQETPWWTLPAENEYLWRQLTYHLAGAGRTAELSELVTRSHWVIDKLRRFGPVAVAEDLALVDTPTAKELTRFLDQAGHLLVPGNPSHAVVRALAQRLPLTPVLDDLRQAATTEAIRQPRLVAIGDLPDSPDPALNRVLTGHDSWVRGCVVALDGSWLASVDLDSLRIWQPDSGQLIRTIEYAGTGVYNDNIALSPDGSLLAVGDDKPAIQLWDTRTWTVHTVLSGHREAIACCCFLADGRFVSADRGKTVRVWDLATGRPVQSFTTPEVLESCVGGLDGRLLSLDDRGLKLWDLGSGSHIALPAADVFMRATLATGPEQRWAAVTGVEGLLIVDLMNATGSPRLLHHFPDLDSAAFSPDGSVLATGGGDGRIALWNTVTWQPMGQIAAHGSAVDRISFDTDGSLMASVANDGSIRLWNPVKALGDLDAGNAEDTAADGFAAASDGSWLAVTKPNSTVVHTTHGGGAHEELKAFRFTYDLHAVGSRWLCFKMRETWYASEVGDWQASRLITTPLAQGASWAAASDSLVCLTDGSARFAVVDTSTWQPSAVVEVTESDLRPAVTAPTSVIDRLTRLRKRAGKDIDFRLAIAPDDSWLAVSTGTTIHIVEPRTLRHIKTLTTDTEPEGLKPLPDASKLLVASRNTIQYWDTTSWTTQPAFAVDEDVFDSVDACWSPDCALLATVSNDVPALRIHDGQDWTCLTEIRLDDTLHGCAWLGDRRLVAVGARGIYWFDYYPGQRPEVGDPVRGSHVAQGGTGV